MATERKSRARKGGQAPKGSIIPQYKKFKLELRGWIDITFTEFKDTLHPLRQKKEWTRDDKAMVRTLVEAGGGYAIKNLYAGSAGFPGASEVFTALKMGDGPDRPEESSKDELESHMNALIKSCTKAGWTSGNYLSFLAYLDSSMTVKDLADAKVPAGASFMFKDAANAAVDRSELGSSTSIPENDLFAEKFRTAIEPYRCVVRESLKKAATAAGLKPSAKS